VARKIEVGSLTTPGEDLGEARLLIDGQLRPSSDSAVYSNVNPATGMDVGLVADASSQDALEAVDAARRAFDSATWSTSVELRRMGLAQLRDSLERHRGSLRRAIVTETGSPVNLTYGAQLDTPIHELNYWLEVLEAFDFEAPFESAVSPAKVLVRHEPVGVVAAITPWNFPFGMNMRKVLPALAAGNTVVLKPAPETPWSATVLGRLIHEETDIPAGVFNVLSSSRHEIGQLLTTSEQVDMIAFTGSTATGRAIMASSASTLKNLVLELGGKSANIVLDDAEDPVGAISDSAVGVCRHAGQMCAVASRLLLPRSRYDEWLEIAVSLMASVQVGDPWDPKTVQGPLISKRQQERVLGHIERARADGARLVLGGAIPPEHPDGFYIQPTLFAGVDPDSRLGQEEVFGPVLAVIPYDDDADAIRIANGTMYGLSGAVSGGDVERALRVARGIRTGGVLVNGGGRAADAPFGGVRQSGIGRENGLFGFKQYMETKTIGLPTQRLM
jgi:aldehyde dehydrogenase (NAD+)